MFRSGLVVGLIVGLIVELVVGVIVGKLFAFWVLKKRLRFLGFANRVFPIPLSKNFCQNFLKEYDLIRFLCVLSLYGVFQFKSPSSQ